MSPKEPGRPLALMDGAGLTEGSAIVRDADMGVRLGASKPAPAYAEVRHVFRMFARAVQPQDGETGRLLQEYDRARDALGLRAVDGEGNLVGGVIHIIDFAEELDEMVFALYPT